jgi:hypothetical protein
MGRSRITAEPVPVSIIAETFAVRQDGEIIRRQCRIAALDGEPAVFRGPKGVALVSVRVQGRIRRIVALRAAWALATGEWPKGIVRARDGDDRNFRAENLIIVKRGKNPFAIGTSSLERRAEVDRTLIGALAKLNGEATLPMLSRLTGSSESCVCTRLGKLAERGLTCSPKCDARRRWELSRAGKEIAAGSAPMALDDRDRNILTALAAAAMGQLRLARRIGSCRLTIKRRTARLTTQGLVFADPRRFFSITAEGRAALGPDAAPERWVRPEMISAAAAKDVIERSPTDNRSSAQLAKAARRARWRGEAAATFNPYPIAQRA